MSEEQEEENDMGMARKIMIEENKHRFFKNKEEDKEENEKEESEISKYLL